jgi:hypothetical protein
MHAGHEAALEVLCTTLAQEPRRIQARPPGPLGRPPLPIAAFWTRPDAQNAVSLTGALWPLMALPATTRA